METEKKSMTNVKLGWNESEWRISHWREDPTSSFFMRIRLLVSEGGVQAKSLSPPQYLVGRVVYTSIGVLAFIGERGKGLSAYRKGFLTTTRIFPFYVSPPHPLIFCGEVQAVAAQHTHVSNPTRVCVCALLICVLRREKRGRGGEGLGINKEGWFFLLREEGKG